MKLPVIFAGHGSPMIALEDNELTKEFQKNRREGRFRI